MLQISSKKVMADDGSRQEIELTRNIFQNILSFKDEKTFTDVAVVIGEAEFPCHRLILASVSDFFKTALTTDMREAREGKITLHGVTEGVFSTLLTSVYEQKNVLTDDNLFDVWAAADMLQMRFLIAQCVEKCNEMFDTKLSTKNCVEYLTQVNLLDQSVKWRVLEFIGQHFSDLHIQHQVRLLSVDELKSLLTVKELELFSEDEVIECALKWAEDNQVSICESLPQEDSSDTQSATSATVLADLLECSRHLLITDGCLHGTLAMHPLVKSDPRCQALLEKISYYQAHPHLHQSWCPPAAVHRESSDMTNVLLVCQLTNSGHLEALDLRDMAWKQITLHETDRVGSHSLDANVLYYKSEVFVHCKNQLNKYFPKFEEGQSVPFSNGIVRAAYDSLYVYTWLKKKGENNEVARKRLFNFSTNFINGKLQYKSLGTVGKGKIDGMSFADVILIGTTEIIFLVGDEDSYTIIRINEANKRYRTFQNQLGSSSRLVTFSHDREAFALQENGCLWRIQLEENLSDLKITHDLVLWDGEISLNGAVLYNDQLLIVGDFQGQSEVSTTLDRSLPSVFHGVMKIKSCNSGDNSYRNIALAELPKNRLKKADEA